MKKEWKTAAVLLLALLLSGCAVGSDLPETEDIQQQYSRMDSLSAVADITLWSEGRRFDYRLAYRRTPESESVTVEEPKEISDLVIPMEKGKPALTEETVLLSPVTGYPEGCSPVDCIPKFYKLLAGGIPTDVGLEKRNGDVLVLLEYEEQEKEGTVLTSISLNGDDGSICCASVSVNGNTRLSCTFMDDFN